jgi:thiol-disulfide isomerase/thioredoxin
VPPRAPPSRAGALLLAAAVVTAAAAGGFFLYRLTTPARPTLYPARAEASRTAPAAAAVSRPPPIPVRLPELTLPGPDGAAHRLAEWKGRPLLINFWATWCEPCRREIPLLRALRHERAAEGLEVVGIALDAPPAVRQYVRLHAIDYPVLLAEQNGLAATNAFGMDTVLPFSVFADRAGQVITLKVGELHRDEADLILDRLRDVDSGALGTASAREQISAGMQRLSAARAGRPPLPGSKSVEIPANPNKK